MGNLAAPELDACLRDGGIVVTASDRAARALTAAYSAARRAEGSTAWTAPRIFDWRTFVRQAWAERALDGRLVLNSTQEQSLWAEIARRGRHPATVLDGPRHRVAALAIEAHELLASHAPRFLRTAARSAWQQDAAAFSEWISAFDETCRQGDLISASRVPLELIDLLQNDNSPNRPPLLLAGFDRILPIQRSLFDAWGAWHEATRGEPATRISYHRAADEKTELAACALWCKQHLAANPDARLLIVTQDATTRRGEIERAFLAQAPLGDEPLFEFSLGVPLHQVPIARSAHLLLRWLSGAIEEGEVDWLFSTSHSALSPQESADLQRYQRQLRRRSLQRTAWSLQAFCTAAFSSAAIPIAWAECMQTAQRDLAALADRPQSPLDWATIAAHLLKTVGWPGFRPLSGAEFQAANRWQQAVDACGSLGFDGRRMRWPDFLSTLARALDETLFAPESRNAPIQIAGPAESAGLTADAIWFLGADEDAWPSSAAAHPFLPLHVQREGAMPHATPQLDWDLAHAITLRLLASASEVHFSYAKQRRDAEARPSLLIAQLASPPQPPPAEWNPPANTAPLAIPFADSSRIPFLHGAVAGGAAVLTAQSQCPFKAFATARLGAQDWQPAEAGLTASQRGQLIHAVLHSVWAGQKYGIRSLDDLRAVIDLRDFVAGHVRRITRDQITAATREQMPRRYLELEESRLTRLITEWLQYELARQPFTVVETEARSSVPIGGLALELRLDRIDHLNDGSLLVIDYKTGDVSKKSWELPRPEDVQLPLYAGFAIVPAEALGGLVFAKVRTGDDKCVFEGRVKDARASLMSGLPAGSALVRRNLNLADMDAWRAYIEQLAHDFVAGRAEADPRDYPGTCERCKLHVLCRIHENRSAIADEDAEDAADE